MPDTLHSITTFDDLLEWLGEELDWPIEDYGLDDLTFEYDADDLGLREEEAEKLADGSIRQLRPLPGGQPFGIFFIEFSGGRLPIVVLRRILNALVVKKRASANPGDRQRWSTADLIFISAFGEDDNREIAFAHFHTTPDTTEIPVLHVLGWSGSNDTPLKLEHVADVLKQRLRWPEDTADHDDWRTQWTGAFRRRPGHVIRTAIGLADTLAGFARKIRDAATTIMAHESETKGQLRKLHRAFKSALIHDLSETDFADMYAQTITYGLLTAAISRTEMSEGRHGTALTSDDITAMVPVTNPFLKEMLQEFLTAGGRSGGIDFDELGINEVVELLRGDETDLPAILLDFGKRKPGEDPVIYFYEEFLKAYNAELKIERGVFYTPQPVVSYIVRSVHELLQTEFGLEDGLASLVTWGEMLEKYPDLKLPSLTDLPDETRTISSDEPFVQILDPATGTATFLVEVIDVVHKHLSKKWQGWGWDEARQKDEWNAYVPKHLLPRLHGYELMMAPYAIAHMKIGLKLAETGYRFETEERARIYLTNALEPWQEQLILPDFGALAHEAKIVNEIKRSTRFTVVLGNPPYSTSISEPEWLMSLINDWKRDLNETKSDLNREEWKFLRLGQYQCTTTGAGVLGFIINRDFLDGITKRQMRKHLGQSFPLRIAVDLNGDVKGNIADENVFDITQGVGIAILCTQSSRPQLRFTSRVGPRQRKYRDLIEKTPIDGELGEVSANPPYYRWVPFSEEISATAASEYSSWPQLNGVFDVFSSGIQTKRDSLCVAFTKVEMQDKVQRFYSLPAEAAREEFDLGKDGRDWTIADARGDIEENGLDEHWLTPILYRPFDVRWTYWTGKTKGFLAYPRRAVMQHIVGRKNLGLIFNRQIVGESVSHFGVARVPICHGTFYLGNKGQDYFAPLLVYNDLLTKQSSSQSNFTTQFLTTIRNIVGVRGSSLTAEDICHYIYAVFYSPGYRNRYSELLKMDFPRLPLTNSFDLFRELARLGGELVALHLLESPTLDTPRAEFFGDNRQIRKVGWTLDNSGTVWIDGKGSKANFKPGAGGFRRVPEEVWNFHIGGYQVCEKWLKDRGPKSGNSGRTLTDEDIVHYQKIIIALTETIRLMAEIDELIEFHGGWPDAFVTSDEAED